MTPTRSITPHRPVTGVFTGHFTSGPGYEAYRPRGTSDYLLIYTLAGRGRFRTEDRREHLLGPDDMILCTPGTFQDYGVEESLAHWELLWAHFEPRAEWLDLLDWPQIEPGLMKLSVSDAASRDQIIDRFQLVHASAMSTGPLRDRVAMNALEGLLLMCEQINPNRSQHPVDHRVRQAMDHITRHLDQKLTLERLSDLTGLSTSRLGHLFREVVGVAPMEFVERQRIERARQLLTMTALSVKEISREVGYETQFYFSLRFKRQTGKSPKAYRESLASR